MCSENSIFNHQIFCKSHGLNKFALIMIKLPQYKNDIWSKAVCLILFIMKLISQFDNFMDYVEFGLHVSWMVQLYYFGSYSHAGFNSNIVTC